MCVQPLSIRPMIQAHMGGALPTPGAAPPTSVKPITRSSSSVAGGWSADSSLRVLSQVIGFLWVLVQMHSQLNWLFIAVLNMNVSRYRCFSELSEAFTGYDSTP